MFQGDIDVVTLTYAMHQFYSFSPWGGGSYNLQFLVSLLYRCYTPKLVQIGSVYVVLEKMLTDDDGRQAIAIGHLSDSDDLIKILITNQESPKKIFKTTSNAEMEKLFEARQAPNIKRTTSWGLIFQGKYLFRKNSDSSY